MMVRRARDGNKERLESKNEAKDRSFKSQRSRSSDLRASKADPHATPMKARFLLLGTPTIRHAFNGVCPQLPQITPAMAGGTIPAAKTIATMRTKMILYINLSPFCC